MANSHLPPVPPASRAPQGGKNATGGKPNPKESRADDRRGGGGKGGVSRVTQSGRSQGDR